MATNQINEGKVLTVTAAGAVTAGSIWTGTNCAGVYLGGGVTGDNVPVALEGVFNVAKTASATDIFTLGDEVYAVATGGTNEAQITGGVPLGIAWAPAVSGATTVRVKLVKF